MPHFESYDKVCEYMDSLGLFSMDMGLGRMEAFWQHRGMPDIPVVHVVGTNGKGSTSTFFESVARAHGVRTGLFTSPHLVTPRERIRIDGEMLNPAVWTRLANMVLDTPGGSELTYFEFQTCLAMLAFIDANVDVAVMEAGMGGRYDATNVFIPGLTLFVAIGMDHEAVLGNTLQAIALDKAGAMHEGGKAITGAQNPEALNVLFSQAQAVGADLAFADDMVPRLTEDLGLRGQYQRRNARLAVAGWLAAAERLGIDSDYSTIAEGLRQAFIAGRFHSVQLERMPPLILDGAHNPHALEALSRTLKEENIRPKALVFGCMADKDIPRMVPLLLGMTDGPIFCPPIAWQRAANPADLVAVLGDKAEAVESITEALQRVAKYSGSVLVCGSLYLLAAFYELYPEFLSRKPQ